MSWGLCALIVALSLTLAPECNTKSVQKRGFADRPVYHAQPIQPIQPLLLVKKEKPVQDFSKIPGVPGVDYPLFHSAPPTSFHCGNVPFAPGMYADVETGCQAYHVCHDGREGPQGATFLCTNGTLFNQQEFTCDWWYNVNCHDAPTFYSLNLDPIKNPYSPKPKPDELKKIVVFKK
ncbi:hypothetical protein J437_LFUL015151 [Ladona fulva]|uniref:Chitin-binding type-2 domain-containing protein n=1 Tax=Ladona fulva TaxID=123851 RepID=A0A8K0KLY9_LADFU|nr:hypothetical protein J437_LFUL015151 [Ladona fulva]